MEENINIFALVLDKLNKNDMWFTTKADPTAEEASSYYKLDEYGEPTEATVKKIEKEVSSLIGDGAVCIEDAVELWVNDALVACRLDYRDNLVTQFEDKPVVDNIEAYENPVQFPQSKKQEAKTKKTENKVFSALNELNASNFVELKDEVEKLYNEEIIDDDQYDKFIDIIDEEENKCEDYLRRRSKVTNTDWKDELAIESDYVVSTLQMLIDEVTDLFENKKVNVKTKKTEGAGAGYHISGTINVNNINSFKVINQEEPDKYGDTKATIECDIDVTLSEMSAFSYEYGNDINVDVPAKVTGLVVAISSDDEPNDIGVDEGSIKVLLDGTKFKTLIGGGWTHTTFTGDIQATDRDIADKEYYFSYFTEIDIQIPDENIVKYIDKVVEGENFFTEFLVYDQDGDIISDEFTAEETDYSAVDKAQDDAIEFAKANKGVRVVKQTYRELADGDLDGYDTEPEVVWEREYNKNYKFDDEVDESKKVVEAKELKFKVNDIVEDKTGVGKIMEIDPEHPEGLIYGVQFSNVDLPDDKDDIGLWWCKEGDISLVTDKAKIDKYNKWFNTEYNKTESKKAERKKKQIEEFKNRKVNFNKRTKEENYQRRLDEVNNKSKNLISDLFSSNDFDSDSPAGQIVMRTSEMFNALSDKGYDVEVTFDNGESTSAIQLGQQGGKVMITITNTDQPLRAFTSGNFEINDQNIKILQDIQSQIEVL